MPLIDKNPPLVEPVVLADMKAFLRIETNDEDALLNSLIKTARDQVERLIGRTLIRRIMVYTGPVPNGACLSIPRPPLLSINSIRLYDGDNNEVEVPTADFKVNTKIEPGELVLEAAQTWAGYLSGANTIEIKFVAGYGDTADEVPLPIRQAIMLIVANLYEHRDTADQPLVPMMADALLMPYRWVRL